ncbi:maleylpyruvate isomerase N-terminal domain-containing protein [Nakamurella leprariae]|uniref:Maleylpyruvate isomerase N-terminal domain-containing protein n=1 Tax=Nakamurella leprariae TaxID=2803911 RepID=A0A938YDN1_9ACTN|nr:maleylpyruvate isomerase N-terminal domain-containing protein [Nakamurella leprariae]MBM9466259.1 maleylpyruvate isomerase N-terminal domain-containing protein [Nakamurella leprariae]
MDDPVFRNAAYAFANLAAQIPEDRWQEPALGTWSVRDLVGHTSRSLTTVRDYLDRPAERVEIGSAAAYYVAIGIMTAQDPALTPEKVAERGRQAGRDLGDDPVASIDALVTAATARVADASGDAVISSIAGGIRVADYLPTRTFELAVHCRDLARALDIDWQLPDPVLTVAVRLATDIALELGAGTFLLDALTGRSPLPEHFSVV